jgi:hypothetical protein
MDTDLVVRAQRGDKEAYADLASGIADRLLAVARRILRDLDLAEDATPPHGGLAGPSQLSVQAEHPGYGAGYPLHGGLAGRSQVDPAP